MKVRVYFLGSFLYWVYHHTFLDKLFTLYYYSQLDNDKVTDFIEIKNKGE